ncbi:MAG TPA: SurA N-terminal domain-containing protein [Gaiellaceae bacterium]
MQKYILRIAFLLAGAALLAACGGGSSASLSSGDVAVVGDQHITQEQYNQLLAQAKLSFKQNGRTFPKEGTTAFEAVKTEVIDLLVQESEREQRAKAEGITVSDQQISNRLTSIKKQYFGGDQKKYLAQLKKEQLTEAQVRQSIKQQLIAEALQNKVTGNIQVSDAEVHDYYKSHSQSYATPESRSVRYILVKSKPTADQLYNQLKSGTSKTWCTLAKKYSLDPSSKGTCGQSSFTKGQTVAAFDKLLFAAPINQVQKPIHSAQYGWFVMEPTSKVKPKSITPEAKVTSSIKQTLLGQKKTTAVNNWASDLQKSFCKGSKISYQTGYQPSPDPCAPPASTNATTTG